MFWSKPLPIRLLKLQPPSLRKEVLRHLDGTLTVSDPKREFLGLAPGLGNQKGVRRCLQYTKEKPLRRGMKHNGSYLDGESPGCHGLPYKVNSVTFRMWWCDYFSAQEWPLEVLR